MAAHIGAQVIADGFGTATVMFVCASAERTEPRRALVAATASAARRSLEEMAFIGRLPSRSVFLRFAPEPVGSLVRHYTGCFEPSRIYTRHRRAHPDYMICIHNGPAAVYTGA